MDEAGEARVCIEVPAGRIRSFFTLLSYGVLVEAPAGISVEDLLCERLNIDIDVLSEKIQTILHDGKAVDDAAGHRLGKSSTLALSAALPGLFGAAFRKQGRFAALRPGITETGEAAGSCCRKITITLKLFNMAADALGPVLLNRGVRVSTDDFIFFWQSRPELAGAASAVSVGKAAVDPRSLAGLLQDGDRTIMLSVKTL